MGGNEDENHQNTHPERTAPSISTSIHQDAKWREDAGHALHKSIFCLLSVGAFLTDRFNLLDLGFPLHAPNI